MSAEMMSRRVLLVGAVAASVSACSPPFPCDVAPCSNVDVADMYGVQYTDLTLTFSFPSSELTPRQSFR